MGTLASDQSYLFYMQKQLKGVAPGEGAKEPYDTQGYLLTCSRSASDVEFVEGQTLYPLLTQDRDDSGHAPPGFDNLDPWPNGPEGMTLEHLLPGTYEVYITAWDNNDEGELLKPGLMLDIYLGNGRDKMVKADTVQPGTDFTGKFAGQFASVRGAVRVSACCSTELAAFA